MRPFELDAADIAALAAEAHAALADARVVGVTQPFPAAIVLEFRLPGRTRYLLLSATPGLARCHLIADPPPPPAAPPRLCQFLRARLGGARIAGIAAIPGERVVRIDFEPHPEVEAPVAAIVAELFGQRPDLICLDATGTILEAHEHRRTRFREIAPGHAYVPMPAREVVEPPAGRLEAARAAAGLADASAAAEAIFGPEEAARALEEHRRTLLALLADLRQRFEGRRGSLERAQVETAGADRARELGELIKANLHAIRTGQVEARLQDFFDPDLKEVTVALDPALPPMHNAERYFKKYRKAKAGRETVARQLQGVARSLERVAGLEERARAAADVRVLDALEEECGAFRVRRTGKAAADAAPHRRKRERGAADQPKRFVSQDGSVIMVGSSARQNDILTFRLANGHDTWLHVEDAAGAHVVVRTDRGKSPSLETLLDAATLAIWHSKFRTAGRASVTYTQRKYVTRPRHAPPGLVMVAQPRRLDVTVERERVERLMQGEAGRDG